LHRRRLRGDLGRRLHGLQAAPRRGALVGAGRRAPRGRLSREARSRGNLPRGMLEILRNLSRRKLRNGLTILGIVIGVLALTTMGALAEKSNGLIDGGIRYFRDHVTVAAETNGGFGGVLTIAKVQDIEQVAGVAAACATTGAPAKTDFDFSVSIGPGDQVIAEQPGCSRYSSFQLSYAFGHAVEEQGGGQVVLGSDIARELTKK